MDLSDASFYYVSMRGVDLSGSLLLRTQLKGADLTGGSLSNTLMHGSDCIAANFTGTDLTHTDLLGASMQQATLVNANLRYARVQATNLTGATMTGAKLTGVKLGGTLMADLDVGPFCAVRRIVHYSPSILDSRTIVKSHAHPDLKPFLLECATPPIFAEYMIDCARSLSESVIQRLMQSVFISYGSPDEAIARRIYEALKTLGIVVFFFPETARLGESIGGEVFDQIQAHDKVLLICSKRSLTRPAVLYEVRQILAREARGGGASYLLPVTLDDFVHHEWSNVEPQLALQVGSKVIASFRGTRRNPSAFSAAMGRVVEALKSKHSTIPV